MRETDILKKMFNYQLKVNNIFYLDNNILLFIKKKYKISIISSCYMPYNFKIIIIIINTFHFVNNCVNNFTPN